VISAESRAGRYHNYDVERPAQLAAVHAASRVYGVKAIADELKVRQTQAHEWDYQRHEVERMVRHVPGVW
jgi:hypothetical protein